MYHSFPSNTSVQSFLNKIKQLPEEYIFIILTFSGSYASMLTKQRYLQERLQEQIPLLIIDVRQNTQVYHFFEQSFPKLFLRKKLPIHLCLRKLVDEKTNSIGLKPVMMNSATLGDRHFAQLRELLQKDLLEKDEGVSTS